MRMDRIRRGISPALFFIAHYILCNGCGPKVMSFRAGPCTTITKEDSIRFSWQARGKTQLIFYPVNAGDEQNPGKIYLMYKLVATKGGKAAASPNLGVVMVGDTVVDNIYINTRRVGDSAVAAGDKDSLVWGSQFRLETVASLSRRSLTVIHNGKSVELDGSGKASTALRGLVNSGPWTISTPLTDAEKRDTTLIPGRLMIKTIVVHAKKP